MGQNIWFMEFREGLCQWAPMDTRSKFGLFKFVLGVGQLNVQSINPISLKPCVLTLQNLFLYFSREYWFNRFNRAYSLAAGVLDHPQDLFVRPQLEFCLVR